MTDLNTLSAAELQAVIEKAEKALRERQSSKRKEVLLQIKDLAASIGVTVEIHEADKSFDRRNSKVAARYCNPANTLQTWSGRGLAPKWMQALMAAGHDKSVFEIR